MPASRAWVVSLFVAALHIAFSSCDIIYFNNAAGPRCSSTNFTQCQFMDPSLWSTGTVPTNGDDVYITVGQPGYSISLVLAELPARLKLGTLYISGQFILNLSGNASVQIVNFYLEKGAALSAQGKSTILSTGTTEVGVNSTLSMGEGSIFLQDILDATSFDVLATASIQLFDSATMVLFSAVSIDGSLSATNTTIFSTDQISVTSNGVLQLDNTPQLGDAVFANITIVLTNGVHASSITFSDSGNLVINKIAVMDALYITKNSSVYLANITSGTISSMMYCDGTGSMTISSSYVSLMNSQQEIDTTIILQGITTLFLDGVILSGDILFGEGELGEDPNITLIAAWLQMDGNYSIYGQILVQGEQLSTSGNISISGGITVTGAALSVSGSLSAGGPVVLFGSGMQTSILDLQAPATIAAPTLNITYQSQLSTEGTIAIVADVISAGIFAVYQGDVDIFGSYTQLEGGVYVAYLNENITATVRVSGPASILGGNITYSTEGNITKHEFVVLSAQTLTGKFQSTPHSFSPDVQPDISNLEIRYDASSVFLSITPPNGSSSDTFFGLIWWIWVGIFGGAFVIIFMSVIGINCIRSRMNNKRKGFVLLPSEPTN